MSSSTQDAIPLFISHEDEIAEKVGSGAKVVWFDGFRDEDCIMPGKTVEEVREEKVQAFLEKYESAHRAGASEEEANSQARAVLKDWTTKGGSVAKSTKRKHKKSKKVESIQPVDNATESASSKTDSTTSTTSSAPPASKRTTNWFKIIVAGRRAQAKPDDLSIASYWLYGVRMPTSVFEAAYEEYHKGQIKNVYDAEAMAKWLVEWERECWAKKLAGMTCKH